MAMDELKRDFRELRGTVQEIQRTLISNTAALSAYNKDLEKHIQMSQDLHQRMVPIEDHVKFTRTLLKLIAWGVGVGAGLAGMASLGLKLASYL